MVDGHGVTPQDAAEAVTGIRVKGKIVKEAKNTVRYEIEDAERLAMGAIYVSKESLPFPYPREIEITIR